MTYTDSSEYQKEIAREYKKRVGNFKVGDIVISLGKLGFANVKSQDLQTTAAGNMNTTYLTRDLVIKINDRGDMPYYYANKVVSDMVGGKAPVVKVLGYDFFKKTKFEILVMKRAFGVPLLDTIFNIPKEDVVKIFKQVLGVVKKLSQIKFENFGWINLQNESYPTYANFLKSEFEYHIKKIQRQKLFDTKDIEKVRTYFVNRLNIFEKEQAVYVHTDTHMGNFLHAGNKLKALIDFDWSLKAPKFRALGSILGFIGYPQQYTEGSKYFKQYKGKNFQFLLPTLKAELKDLFKDRLLLQKLNLTFINDGVMWMADGWSDNWSKEMMKNILENEMPKNESELKQTYYGKIIEGKKV